MPVPNQIESILKDELHALLASLKADVQDPILRANLLAMAEDAAMLPIRLARGEDVTSIYRSLSAEAQNRAMTHRIQVQEIVREAWTKALTRILAAVFAAL
jgi:hypothetical protein